MTERKRGEMKPARDVMHMAFPPPTEEETYRRGYQDGFVVALDAIWETMFTEHASRQQAYDHLWRFWQNELFRWRRAAEDDPRLVLPPDPPPLSRQRKDVP